MSAPASTVPAAMAGLFTLVTTKLAADASASSVLLCYGEPTTYQPNDIIQIGTNVRRTVTPELLMGGYDQAYPLRENYTIDCVASAWTGSSDALTVIQRAYVLANYIEAAVRADPSLGTTVLEAHPAGTDGGNAVWTDEPAGRQCDLTVSIAVLTLN